MKTKMKNWFYTGLISLLPVVLTVYFINWVSRKALSFVGRSFLVRNTTQYLVKHRRLNSIVDLETYIKVIIYILAILGVLLVITLAGMTLQLVIGRKIASMFERLFRRVPIIKQIYSTLSQITTMVSSDKTKSYQKVVLLQYPSKGIYSLGFLTSQGNEYFEEITGRPKLLNIFVPTSPNPTSGMFIMVKEEDAVILDMKIEEAVKLIISGGAIVPEKL